MKPLKIIILSGMIFPQNSPRSFRATELACGFAKQGNDVTLYSVLGDYDYSSFEKETGVQVKGMGSSPFGNLNSDNEFLSDSKLFWAFKGVLTRLFYNIIDYPRVEFFFKTIRVLKSESNFDYLITVAHPFGLHWGAAYFKKYISKNKFKVWTSDCGDPFMGDPDVNRKKVFLEPIEKFWCGLTDFITIPVKAAKTGYYKEFWDKINIIPQGIDFKKAKLLKYKKNDIPTFLYSGVVYPGMRDPSIFLEYLCKIQQNFKLIVYVPDDAIFGEFKERLGDKLEIRNYIPRLDLIKILSSMDFILNFKNTSEVQQPSKLIDYGLSKRPIIEISSLFSEKEKIVFEQFLREDYQFQREIDDFSQFEITNVCDKFIELYEQRAN